MDALAATAYRHRVTVPAAAWHAWARSPGLLEPLAAQLASLGVAAGERQRLLRDAAEAADWRALARLDAACRHVRQLVATGALRRGRQAARLAEALALLPPPSRGAAGAAPLQGPAAAVSAAA